MIQPSSSESQTNLSRIKSNAEKRNVVLCPSSILYAFLSLTPPTPTVSCWQTVSIAFDSGHIGLRLRWIWLNHFYPKKLITRYSFVLLKKPNCCGFSNIHSSSIIGYLHILWVHCMLIACILLATYHFCIILDGIRLIFVPCKLSTNSSSSFLLSLAFQILLWHRLLHFLPV